MNRTSTIEKMLQKLVVLLLAVVIPALAWGQKKAPSAPAQHASAPKAAPKAAAPSHSASQSHASTPSKTTTGSRPATAGGSHTAAGGTHTATGGSHPATAGGTHAATGGTHTAAGGTHAATAGGTHGAAGGTHAAAGGSHPAAGHAAAPAGHAAAASRSNVGSHTPAGTRNVSLKGGGSASIRKNGSVRSIDRGGMHIERGVHGGRTTVTERNGARIVTRGHGGYVQRAYLTRGGHAYYSRTFYAGGRYHVGLYRGYGWGGRTYFGYYPGVWYHPGFYGWGFHPWGAPVFWGVGAWGWGGAPWWGFYGGWWNPYPSYAAPYFWLTDYLLAQSLQAAYAARAEANADAVAADAAAGAGDNGGGGDGGDAAPAASSGVTLTPEVKDAIAQEVKAQLAAQQAQAATQGGAAAGAAPAPTDASNTPPPALDPAQRTFVVDSDVTAVANGQECGLTAGDVVTRLTDTPDADQTVNASVSATKKGDCASGQTVAVKVDDLQEMYNHFQEQLTNGLGDLAKKQGTGGMPAAPDVATQASAVPPPAPDTSVAKTLQDQQAQADSTEAQVKQEAASGGGH
jgi:hypothetical protein